MNEVRNILFSQEKIFSHRTNVLVLIQQVLIRVASTENMFTINEVRSLIQSAAKLEKVLQLHARNLLKRNFDDKDEY